MPDKQQPNSQQEETTDAILEKLRSLKVGSFWDSSGILRHGGNVLPLNSEEYDCRTPMTLDALHEK